MFEEHANKLLIVNIAITINVSLEQRVMNYQLMWHTSCTNSSVSSIDSTSPIVCITSAKSVCVMETSFKKLFQCWPAVFTNPFPSLSNTLNASLISSSISESLNSLEQSTLPVQLFLLGHQPDKLIETDVTVAVLNQFVREFIYLIYHIYMAIKI